MRHLIEEGEDTPDETREKVKEEWNERKPIEEKYAQCEELDKQLKEKDVKTNKYTTTTITQLKTVHMNPTIAYVEGYLEQGEVFDFFSFFLPFFNLNCFFFFF